MLLTITTTHNPATNLGFLLHKHPAKVQSFNLNFGQAHVFYPEANEERCTAALLLEIDPVGLVRGKSAGGNSEGLLDQYVNDRPYVASSFLSVAIAEVFGTAMAGRCNTKPELTQVSLPFSIKLAVVPCRGGEKMLRRLFEPLGYTVNAQNHLLDETFPAWGNSSYYTVTLEANCRLSELLSHLYVLIPVLDDEKHYWVGDDEVEKLLKKGEGWLSNHPERELIASRYLKKQRHLVREALARLVEEDPTNPEEAETQKEQEEAVLEAPISLNRQRLNTVVEVLRQKQVKRVLDLGCGEGNLLRVLLEEKQFEEIVGVDVSPRVLERATERLHLDRLPTKQRERIKLLQGALTYRDKRLSSYDGAAVVEVIEHLDLPRLSAFERALFEFAHPGVVVITTPNVEYNVRFESLPAGKLRHRDHRFEWTRAEFQAWAQAVATKYGYTVSFAPIGQLDEDVGAPTQMAVFERE